MRILIITINKMEYIQMKVRAWNIRLDDVRDDFEYVIDGDRLVVTMNYLLEPYFLNEENEDTK